MRVQEVGGGEGLKKFKGQLGRKAAKKKMRIEKFCVRKEDRRREL
jgi:flagellar motor switch protein FliM